ncbi:hypothetical protein [Methylobacterium sp. 1030]|uniref:hypothetical protein n=1 Tax=Methylobacterium sp. 1030 TaxID=3156404 RepID=UPI003391B51B
MMTVDSTDAPKAQDEKTLLKQVLFIKAVTADPEVTPFGKAVANALIFTFWNKDEGKARPGHARLAREAGINVTAVKRGIKSLQDRGWFAVEPAWDESGDPAPNHYYPIWKRAESKAPAGSERPKKAVRNPANKITFQAGPVRLTADEVAEIERRVTFYAMPLFDDLRKSALSWTKDNWRANLETEIASYEAYGEPPKPADEEEVLF